MANQVLNGPGELESQKECNAFTHEWEEEYYGYRCSNCLEFVDTDSWMAWMSGEEDEEWEFIPTDLEPLQ
jgi:hypothetical protein